LVHHPIEDNDSTGRKAERHDQKASRSTKRMQTEHGELVPVLDEAYVQDLQM
jgi:hypothetical protein